MGGLCSPSGLWPATDTAPTASSAPATAGALVWQRAPDPSRGRSATRDLLAQAMVAAPAEHGDLAFAGLMEAVERFDRHFGA